MCSSIYVQIHLQSHFLNFFLNKSDVIKFVTLLLQDENVPPVSFFEVMRLNLSEWPYILVGTICAMINGAMQPAFTVIFAMIIGVSYPHLHSSFSSFFIFKCKKLQIRNFFASQVFANSNQETAAERSVLFSLMFAVIGCISFVTMFLQVYIRTHMVALHIFLDDQSLSASDYDDF